MKEYSDEQILDDLASDENFDRGFGLLVHKYQEQLYWHIRRLVHFHEDADDVIQNTFIKVFRHIKSFKRESKLYTWLYRIASNEAISFLKKRKKRRSLGQTEKLEQLGQDLKADYYFDGEEAEILLIQATEILPSRQKLVFRMRYNDDMSYDDMSEVLGITVGAIKASYHHAVKKIENYLKENIDYAE